MMLSILTGFVLLLNPKSLALSDVLPTFLQGSPPEELACLAEEIEAYRIANHPHSSVAFWAESYGHGYIAHNENEIRPAASTIKIFILVAAYLQFLEVWDEVPDELPSILLSEEGFRSPLAMLSSQTRDIVRNELGGMTYGQLAGVMMGLNQAYYTNSSYNAAANILIFLLGGPEECTSAVQGIHPDFASVRIGRYMLSTRTPDNDNVASVRSLATACRLISSRDIPGIDEVDCTEIIACFQHQFIYSEDTYQKHGHLSEAPSVNTWVGWMEGEEGSSIYCISVVQWDENTIEDEGADHYVDLCHRAVQKQPLVGSSKPATLVDG